MGETTLFESSIRPDRLPNSRRSPIIRLTVYLTAGLLLIYLSTWVGPLTFYWTFQRPLAAGGEEARKEMVWRMAATVPLDPGKGWTAREEHGVTLPLPPGNLVEIRKEGEWIEAELEEGVVQYQAFPPGFLLFLYAETAETIGHEPDDSVSDAALLRRLVHESPGRYRFSWGADERQTYATRILCKMLLWESFPVKRVEIASGPSEARSSVLVEYENGRAKIIAAREDGVMVVIVPRTAPAAWKESPAHWLAGS